MAGNLLAHQMHRVIGLIDILDFQDLPCMSTNVDILMNEHV